MVRYVKLHIDMPMLKSWWNFFCCFCLFRATPVAYGGSKARGRISAVVATATAKWDMSRVCDLYHSSGQCQILNPLSEARD